MNRCQPYELAHRVEASAHRRVLPLGIAEVLQAKEDISLQLFAGSTLLARFLPICPACDNLSSAICKQLYRSGQLCSLGEPLTVALRLEKLGKTVCGRKARVSRLVFGRHMRFRAWCNRCEVLSAHFVRIPPTHEGRARWGADGLVKTE